MTNCATYLEPPSSQLKDGGRTGRYDCTAWAQSRAIAHATCGDKVPSGRTIRVLSSEPVPDPKSPGLNLVQVAAVARKTYGVEMDVYVGSRALTWEQYENRRRSGRGAIIQVGYGPVADSEYDAGRGFRSNHAMEEDQHQTLDSLADGRAPGVYENVEGEPVLYRRSVMRRAAEQLVVGTFNGKAILAGPDKVWCAMTRDVVPPYRVDIVPRPGRPQRRYRQFLIEDGEIKDFVRRLTRKGIHESCTPPRAFTWKGRPGIYYLVQITSGPNAGRWVNDKFGREK